MPLLFAIELTAARITAEVVDVKPNGTLVLDLYDEILGAAKPDTLFVDSSTIDVADARDAAGRAQAAGHRAIDAPVSGGVAGAAAGTLAFMVGGTEEDFAAAQPLLDVMGRKVVHCGGSGNGQAAKICNNMILGVSMIGVSEAFVLAEKLGLSHKALFDVASTSSGRTGVRTAIAPLPSAITATSHDLSAIASTAFMKARFPPAVTKIRVRSRSRRFSEVSFRRSVSRPSGDQTVLSARATSAFFAVAPTIAGTRSRSATASASAPTPTAQYISAMPRPGPTPISRR